MNIDWQDIVVVLIVIVAAASIIRQVGRKICSRRSGGCASCHGCEKTAESDQTLIDLR